jgi:hypothetical protein
MFVQQPAGECNVGNGEDGFEPARRTDDLSAIRLTELKKNTDYPEF